MTNQATAQSSMRTGRQSLSAMRKKCWLLFTFVCVSAAGFAYWQNTRLHRALKQYEARYESFDQAAAASISKTMKFLSEISTQHPPPTKEEVEARLNEGQPLTARRYRNVTIAEYEIPVAGMICELRFTDDRFSGFDPLSETIQWPAAPKPSFCHRAALAARRIIERWGVMAWLFIASITVVLVLLSGRQPALLAALSVDFQLMTAAFVLLAGVFRWSQILAAGKVSGGWQPRLPMAHLYMFAIGIGLLLWFRLRTRGIDPRLCPVCDYSLTGNVSGICPECGTPIRCDVPAAE